MERFRDHRCSYLPKTTAPLKVVVLLFKKYLEALS